MRAGSLVIGWEFGDFYGLAKKSVCSAKVLGEFVRYANYKAWNAYDEAAANRLTVAELAALPRSRAHFATVRSMTVPPASSRSFTRLPPEIEHAPSCR